MSTEGMIKSHKAAIVIIPKVSAAFLDRLQTLRKTHDKAFKRWMPHINLVYPFVERPGDGFRKEEVLIKRTLSKYGVNRFSMQFSQDSVGFFEHSNAFNLFIKPLNAQSVLDQLFSSRAPTTEESNEPGSQSVTISDSSTVYSPVLGFVDPFAGCDSEHSASLFDLHLAVESRSHHRTVEEPSFGCLWNDKSYGYWGIDENSGQKGSDVITCEKKLRQKPSGDVMLDRETVEFYDEATKDPSIDRLAKMAPLDRLQSALVEAFPQFNDLNTISSTGFQAHLTLGQFKKVNLEKSLGEVKEALFKGDHIEEVLVDEIHIITRAYDTPFKVAATIRLNVL